MPSSCCDPNARKLAVPADCFDISLLEEDRPSVTMSCAANVGLPGAGQCRQPEVSARSLMKSCPKRLPLCAPASALGMAISMQLIGGMVLHEGQTPR